MLLRCGGFQVKSMRRVVVLLIVLVALLALTGCSQPSIVGKWFNPKTGDVTTIDKEWITDAHGTPVKYTVTGDTALQITKNGQTADVKYELKGDALTMTMPPVTGGFVRVDSSAYVTAKAAWDKQQAATKATSDAQDVADKKKQDAAICADLRSAVSNMIVQYHSDLIQGRTGKYAYFIKSGMPTAQAKTLDNKAWAKVHAEFAAAKTLDDVVQVMTKVGTQDNGYNAIISTLPADLKCPSGGEITVDGWNSADQWNAAGTRLILKCSIHGTATQ
jgi:hypothetical protein